MIFLEDVANAIADGALVPDGVHAGGTRTLDRDIVASEDGRTVNTQRTATEEPT